MKKARLNIYVGDPAIRKQVKTAAAKQDISVSDYCLRAIAEKLAQEGESIREESNQSLLTAVDKARQFQKKVLLTKNKFSCVKWTGGNNLRLQNHLS